MGKGKKSSGLDLPMPLEALGLTKQERAYRSIRDAILNGLLQSGDRLPSSRVLAERWKIARGTVESVFDRLQLEGYLVRRIGSGSRVSALMPNSYLNLSDGDVDESSSVEDLKVSPVQEQDYRARIGIPFVARLANPMLIRPAEWATQLHRAMSAIRPEQMCNIESQGAFDLRNQIAIYLRKHRGIDCCAEHILITNGIRHSIDLVSRCVINVNDSVCVEDPGYPAVHRIFEKAGANIVYAPIDAEGINLRGVTIPVNCRLAYVTPAHQSPLGVIMSATRRLELLDWARRQDAWIIEDDYDSEFNYQSAPLPALKSIDTIGRVIYCGSFNQALFSNLRIGYVIAPPDLHKNILSLWRTIGRSVGVSEQLGLAEFMRGPAFLRHIRRARKEYQALRDVVIKTLSIEAAGFYRISGEHAGFHFVLWPSPGINLEGLMKSASELGLLLQPLERSCRNIVLPPAFILGYAALTQVQANNAAHQLAKALVSNG
ncbi:PLP-dependent aminotransferase family protein [Pseudomonas sp. EggHat1]|uniref:MocR-like pyridoxine biosynthesis transcription factor PdxR n=1 Tax=Pseudomonas sp. EggHat1 TaxID=2761624 RepID=UPI001867E5E6|nr:PLP-dependent aminotransferase family protein [Pseudomonas sp. EggHat1]